MTTDLKTQLRGFAQELSSDLPTVEVDEILAGGDRVRLVELASHGRGPLVKPRRGVRAAAAAVVIAVLIGGVAWLTRGGSEQDVINQTTLTTVINQTTLTTAPEALGIPDFDAYFATAAASGLVLGGDPNVVLLRARPEPEFDASVLGLEVVLEPFEPDANIPGIDFPELELPAPTGPMLYVGRVSDSGVLFAVYQIDIGVCNASWLLSELQWPQSIGCGGREGYGPVGNDGIVFVPLDTSVVAITTTDGQSLWQRPIGGWSFFDLPSPPPGSPGHRIVAYDAFGNQIGNWGSNPGELEAWASSTTTTMPLPSDEALAVADAYFAAYNAGDIDAVFSLFTPDNRPGHDGTKRASYTWEGKGVSVGGGVASEGGDGPWNQRLYLDAAQGTVLRSPSCTLTDDQSPEHTLITCVYEIVDAPTRAVNAPSVPVTMMLTLTPAGISEITETYGEVDFDHVREPFRRWLEANRPDVTCLAQTLEGGWCTDYEDEDSEERFGDVALWTDLGRIIAQYADEWAAYLQENNCSYLDGC